MQRVDCLGGRSIEMTWEAYAKNELSEMEELLEYTVKIGQKKKLLIYTDCEDRDAILRIYEDRNMRTRTALKEAGILFQEKKKHEYDTDWRHVRRGFDREDIYIHTFHFTAALDRIPEYISAACRESAAGLSISAAENEAFAAISGSAPANEFAVAIAEKAAEAVRNAKQKNPSRTWDRLECHTTDSSISLYPHSGAIRPLFFISFAANGLKKLDDSQQRAMNDLAMTEICRNLNALTETEAVFVFPSRLVYESGDYYYSAEVKALFVLDEKNRSEQLQEW